MNALRPRRGLRLCVLAAAATVASTSAVPVIFASAAGTPTVGSCPMFPADNVWNTDISTLPVNRMSATWIASSGGPGQHIHPDWGPSGGSVPYGIPWQLVDASHQKVAVSFQYADESDPGPYPLGPDTPIEGGSNSTGDRHALVVDQSTCTLYETWSTYYSSSGSHAGSGAIFHLTSDALRPAGWTSADAGGLPILPGLVRYVEVQAGAIRHAIRFTVQQTDTAYIWPARHQAGARSDPSLPPMGARFRLKAGVDIAHFSAQAQVVLTAMKHYGLILADNGSNWYFQGDTDPGWSDSVLSELKTIPAGDFEAVDESSLMLDPNSAAARQAATGGTPPAMPRATARPTPRPTAAPPSPSSTPTASSTPAALAEIVSSSPSPSPDSTSRAAPPAARTRVVAADTHAGASRWLLGLLAILLAAAAAAAAFGASPRRRARG